MVGRPRVSDARLDAFVAVVSELPSAAERVDFLLGEVDLLASAGAAFVEGADPAGAVGGEGDAGEGVGAVAEGLAAGGVD